MLQNKSKTLLRTPRRVDDDGALRPSRMLNPLPEQRIIVRALHNPAIRRRPRDARPLAPQRRPPPDPLVQQRNVFDGDPALDVPVRAAVLARDGGAAVEDLGEVARAVDDDGAVALAQEIGGEDPLEAVGEAAGLVEGEGAVEEEGFEEVVIDGDAVERGG